jgi:hypothetical protein
VSYSALRFASAPGLGVVFFQAPSGGVCLDSPDEVASCLRTFTAVRTAALTAEATADLLRESTEALRPPWD